MTELEQRLTALGRVLEVPPTPDLAAAVRSRLEPRPARRRLRPRVPRRVLVAALGLAVVLAGTALAVPSLRHALERVLDLQGATVVRIPRLPPLAQGAGRLELGTAISVSHARTAASFLALLPASRPDDAYLSHDLAGGRLTLVEGRVLIMEFRGQATPLMEKVIGPGTSVQRVRVNGSPGVYLSGAPHELLFYDAAGVVRTDTVRLAGNVLLWQQGPLIVRIEGVGSLAAALRLAASLH